jgi:hypothetical protein
MKPYQFVIGIVISMFGIQAYAATEAVDSGKIVYVLRNSKAVKPDTPLNATLVEKEAIIMTVRQPKATDKDCKIDAVLISKELFNAFPDQISRIRILFAKPNTNVSSQVDVTAGDVKAFGSGAINVDALLSSLDLSDVQGSAPSSSGTSLAIAPGPLADKRLMLLSRIEGLRSKGTSVKPFMDIFTKIETEVPSVPLEQLTKDIAYLNEKLSDQETLVKQVTAKRAPSGATGPSGALGMPQFSSDSAKVEQRCKDWLVRLDQWRRQGRDVNQLVATIGVTRMLLAEQTPQSIQKASATLDALNFLFKDGPPP